jgi:hypothetical protein
MKNQDDKEEVYLIRLAGGRFIKKKVSLSEIVLLSELHFTARQVVSWNRN